MLMPVPALLPDAADRLAAVHELAVEIPPRVADVLSRPAQALARIADGLPRMAQPVHKSRLFLADAGVDLALGDLLRRLALNALRLFALPCQLREPVQIAPDRRGVVLDSFLRALLRHLPETFLRSLLELRDEVQQLILRFALIDRIPDIRVACGVPVGDPLRLLRLQRHIAGAAKLLVLNNNAVIPIAPEPVCKRLPALRRTALVLLHLSRKTFQRVGIERVRNVQINGFRSAAEPGLSAQIFGAEPKTDMARCRPALIRGVPVRVLSELFSVEYSKLVGVSRVVDRKQPPVIIPDRAVPEIRLLRLAELAPLTVLADGKLLLGILLQVLLPLWQIRIFRVRRKISLTISRDKRNIMDRTITGNS